MMDISSLNSDEDDNTPSISSNNVENNTDPLQILKNLKISNLNSLININSIRNKFDSLQLLVKGNLDILVITETKLDNTFPSQQFAIEGYATPFRLDKSSSSGGVIIYVRGDIPCRQLFYRPVENNIEGILLEVNLRKSKWLIFGGYNNNKSNIDNFLGYLGPILDHFMSTYENILLLGDFNSETKEKSMAEFCDIYHIQNLITVPTCYKNPLSPSSIDVILTNKIRSFQNSQTIETGLSDHHKMIVTVLRAFFKKQDPVTINYRDYKSFDKSKFHYELKNIIDSSDMLSKNINYELFESSFMELLNKHAPMRKKYVRANNAPFMNRNLSKAIMTRSRLRNKFLKNPNESNKSDYNRQRNYCVNLLRREKKKY